MVFPSRLRDELEHGHGGDPLRERQDLGNRSPNDYDRLAARRCGGHDLQPIARIRRWRRTPIELSGRLWIATRVVDDEHGWRHHGDSERNGTVYLRCDGSRQQWNSSNLRTEDPDNSNQVPTGDHDSRPRNEDLR